MILIKNEYNWKVKKMFPDRLFDFDETYETMRAGKEMSKVQQLITMHKYPKVIKANSNIFRESIFYILQALIDSDIIINKETSFIQLLEQLEQEGVITLRRKDNTRFGQYLIVREPFLNRELRLEDVDMIINFIYYLQELKEA